MLEAGLVVSRFLHFSATLVLFGWLFFPLVVRTAAAPTKPALVALAATSTVGGVAWFTFAVASMADSLSAAFAPQTIETVITQTSFGPLWLARLALIAAMLAWIALRPTPSSGGRWLASLTGIASASLAGTGHAALGDGIVGIAHMAADALHLLAAGAWLGGIAGLALMLRRRLSERASEAARDFSGLGYGAVAILLASGLANSWIMLGSPSALVSTAYGQLLCVKVALFLAMLALAAYNRLRLAPRLATGGDASAFLKLRRNAYAELAIGAVVIAVVAALGTMQPPSS